MIGINVKEYISIKDKSHTFGDIFPVLITLCLNQDAIARM